MIVPVAVAIGSGWLYSVYVAATVRRGRQRAAHPHIPFSNMSIPMYDRK